MARHVTLGICSICLFLGWGPIWRSMSVTFTVVNLAVWRAAVRLGRAASRDAPNNLDYRCGPKIGKCPVGTCCSGAGMCQNSVSSSSLLMAFCDRFMRHVQGALPLSRLARANRILTHTCTRAACTDGTFADLGATAIVQIVGALPLSRLQD
jgi:hypothetical protein